MSPLRVTITPIGKQPIELTLEHGDCYKKQLHHETLLVIEEFARDTDPDSWNACAFDANQDDPEETCPTQEVYVYDRKPEVLFYPADDCLVRLDWIHPDNIG